MVRFAKENLIVLSAAALLALAATLLVYLPQSRKLDEIKSQAIAQKLATRADLEKSRIVPEMVRQVAEMKSRYHNMDRRLPKQKELGGFLRDISVNLVQEKLSNQFIQPGTPAKEDMFHTLPIIMKFQGTYLSTAGFLKRIDEMERLTRVQKMVIAIDPSDKGPKADKTENNLSIELQLNIYFTES